MTEQRDTTATMPAAGAAISPEGVECLSRMPGCELAQGAPDVRGWEVTSPTSAHLGVVNDLLIDLATLRVRYLDVTLDAGPTARRVLLPIGKVWINEALDEVVVPTSPSLDALPEYDPARFSREFEQDLLAAFGDEVAKDFYTGAAFDDVAARGARPDHVTCGRRESDAGGAACPVDAPNDPPEAANGVELPVVADAAD